MTETQHLSSIEDKLTAIEKKIEAVSFDRKWLRTSEVADYLNLSLSQINVLKSQGTLKYSKLAGTIFFDRAYIDKLLTEKLNELSGGEA